MRRPSTLLAALVLLAFAPVVDRGGASVASAQDRAGIEIRLPDPASRGVEGPLVRVAGALNERELRDLLEHAFPVRIHYRTELWTVAGWFDDLRDTREWDVVVRYDPLRKSYAVVRIVGEQVTPLGEFASHADAVQAAERPYRVAFTPPRGRRSYYSTVVDIETLSLSDLDEVERWLRGELQPVVRGRRNPGTAVGRGLRTLAVRLLGSTSRHYEARSGTFRP